MRKENAKRGVILAVGMASLWAVGYFFGITVVPVVYEVDKAISGVLNPDSYFPVLDEFFRALTDYSNFLILISLLSLAIAIGVFNLTQMPLFRAIKQAAKACFIFWLVLIILKFVVGFSLAIFLLLALVPPIIIIVGAFPPLFSSNICARRWIVGLLYLELFIVLALWFGHKLWWNQELPGANYMLFPCLFIAILFVIHLFSKLDAAGMKRYIGVFWLVIASGLIVDLALTKNLKETIGRPRPLNEAHQPWSDTLRVIPGERLTGNNSFPSGHVAGTVSLLTPLFWWVRDRRAKAALATWGGLQGVSRVYTVAHFTSDCIVGATLGFCGGTLIFFMLGGPGLRVEEEENPEQSKVAVSR